MDDLARAVEGLLAPLFTILERLASFNLLDWIEVPKGVPGRLSLLAYLRSFLTLLGEAEGSKDDEKVDVPFKSSWHCLLDEGLATVPLPKQAGRGEDGADLRNGSRSNCFASGREKDAKEWFRGGSGTIEAN